MPCQCHLTSPQSHRQVAGFGLRLLALRSGSRGEWSEPRPGSRRFLLVDADRPVGQRFRGGDWPGVVVVGLDHAVLEDDGARTVRWSRRPDSGVAGWL